MKIQFKGAPRRGLEIIQPENPTVWHDWNWQLRNSLKSKEDFKSYFHLNEDEEAAFDKNNQTFSIRSTPYYASLADATDVNDPIRKILMPSSLELKAGAQQMTDPLGEKENNPAHRIIHRYSDRVLFLVTDICSVYCRYCTRKYFTGHDQAFIKQNEFDSAIHYIKTHPGIREVILSGGDPLTLSNGQIDKVLTEIRKIPHVEIIRIGSRIPVVCPMRIDDDLVKILKKHKPVFLMTHFNHPNEVTFEAAEALEKFVDNGVPTFNQMVLLNGINNHPAIVQALSRRLLYLRVKPYYMFQCDPSEGTDHLRTSIDDSLEIQKELWGHISGLAMPNLSVDIPHGGGKVYYTPQFETFKDSRIRKYQGWDGVEASYINPLPEHIIKPKVTEDLLQEWEEIKSAKKGI